MQEERFRQLENRASKLFPKDKLNRLEAETLVHDEIERMKDQGEAFVISEEEEKMLVAFRAFKLRMRHHVEFFRWKTQIEKGVVLAKTSGLIVHPQEVDEGNIKVPAIK